jgi:hypothetical protein
MRAPFGLSHPTTTLGSLDASISLGLIDVMSKT